MVKTELGRALTMAAETAGYGGRGDRVRLHRELRERYGVTANLQSLLNWMSGERTPELANLRALLDALKVFGEQRESIVRLALPDGLLDGNRPSLEDADTEIDPDGPPAGAA